MLMVLFTVGSWVLGVLINDDTLVFFISVGFVAIILKQASGIIGWYLGRPPVSPIFVSKYVFPMYSYNPHSDQIEEETEIGFALYKCLVTAFLWGIFCIIFATLTILFALT